MSLLPVLRFEMFTQGVSHISKALDCLLQEISVRGQISYKPKTLKLASAVLVLHVNRGACVFGRDVGSYRLEA